MGRTLLHVPPGYEGGGAMVELGAVGMIGGFIAMTALVLWGFSRLIE